MKKILLLSAAMVMLTSYSAYARSNIVIEGNFFEPAPAYIVEPPPPPAYVIEQAPPPYGYYRPYYYPEYHHRHYEDWRYWQEQREHEWHEHEGHENHHGHSEHGDND